jgi:site-specific recombinase XerD
MSGPALPAPLSAGALPALFEQEVARTRDYIDAARATATRRAYAADWRVFTAWCAARGLTPLPATPATVAVFLTVMKDGDPGGTPPAPPRKVSTLSRYLAAINDRHRETGHLTPGEQDGGHALRRTFAGIRNIHGTRPARKAAADGDVLERMLAGITGADVRSVRDRALLAIGMAAALRRSELVALTCRDILVVPEGLRLFVARSKTDQTARGTWIAIPEGRRIRPKALLLAWLRAGDIADGPVFRKLAAVRVAVRDPESGTLLRDADGRIVRQWREDRVQPGAMSAQGVALVIKARARVAGLDPALFAGHSLRAGFLTEAARQPGANLFKMREVSRHKSIEILADYVRNHDLFRDHAGDGFL